jgi:ELWxxDGT repeat protein
MKPLLLFVLLSFVCSLCPAQSIELIKDLVPGSSSSDVLEYQEANGTLFFTVASHSIGSGLSSGQLWKTNGDSNSTVMIREFIHPDGQGKDLLALTSYKKKVYFIANDTTSGSELWTSDGTTAGTHVVKDIFPGPEGGLFSPFGLSACRIRVFHNKLYFGANDGQHGWELWRSDGTDAGTDMVVDINVAPEQDGFASGLSTNLEVAGNKLFFGGMGTDSTYCLYVSDGSAQGTHGVPNVLPSAYGAFISFNNKICFVGAVIDSNNVITDGFCISDGTFAGTKIVLPNLQAGNFDWAVLNGQLYFCAESWVIGKKYICVTDGTDQGSFLLMETTINGLSQTIYLDKRVYLTEYKNKVYFLGPGNAIPTDQLWETDGTIVGTHEFTDLYPAVKPWHLSVVNGNLYFKIKDSLRVELWKTDGSVSGTARISKPSANSVYGGVVSSYQNLLAPIKAYNDLLVFTGSYDTLVGRELYKLSTNPSAINQMQPVTAENLYPNPVKEVLSIPGNNIDEIIIYDACGKILMQEKQNIIHVFGLSPGLYFAEIHRRGNVSTARFIKE